MTSGAPGQRGEQRFGEAPDLIDEFLEPLAEHPLKELIIHEIAHLALRGFDASDPSLLAMATRAVEIRVQRDRSREVSVKPAPKLLDQVIYYARLDSLVKIGFSGNIRARRNNLLGAQGILALEFGGRDLEAQRHQEFLEHRVSSEWFRLEPLAAHIAERRQAFEAAVGTSTEEWIAALPPAGLLDWRSDRPAC